MSRVGVGCILTDREDRQVPLYVLITGWVQEGQEGSNVSFNYRLGVYSQTGRIGRFQCSNYRLGVCS